MGSRQEENVIKESSSFGFYMSCITDCPYLSKNHLVQKENKTDDAGENDDNQDSEDLEQVGWNESK